MLRTLWRFIWKHTPPALSPLVSGVYRTYVGVNCVYLRFTDPAKTKDSGFTALPPALMRYRISGKTSLKDFLSFGEGLCEMLAGHFASVGGDLARSERVLDFGCGCGRIIIWMTRRFPQAKFYGTDTDAEAIAWCQQNLPDASFSTNAPYPPLSYPDNYYDAVYATSVFTHLTERAQFAWLAELRRVLKPGGVALVSLHGKHYRDLLAPSVVSEIERKGFLAITTHHFRDGKVKSDSAGTNDGQSQPDENEDGHVNSYITQEYVEREFAPTLDIVSYIPGTPGQDIVLLRKRAPLE